MIQSAGRLIEYEGGEAMLFVMRNNGECWGRLVLPDDTNLDVETRKDHYDDDDETALDAFERAEQGDVSKAVSWEMTWNQANKGGDNG